MYQSLYQLSSHQPHGFKSLFVPGSETYNINLTAMTSNVHQADVATFPAYFKFFLPPGTIYASATVYTPRDTREGFVCRYGKKPDCRYCTGKTWEQMPWVPYTQVRFSELAEHDVYLSALGGHAEVLPTVAFPEPLTAGNWMYTRQLPFTGDNIQAIQVTFRVDKIKYQQWYNAVQWDTVGDPLQGAAPPIHQEEPTMTYIHNIFAPYRVAQGDTPQIIGQKGIAFKLLVDNLSNKMGASWAFIMWMSFKGMPYATPDNLEAVWHSWGIDTVEKLVEFVNSFNEINVKEIIDDISPFITIDLKNRQKISPSELTQLVNDQCNIETLNIHFTDNCYFLPMQTDLENLLHYSRLPQIQYIPEKRDCDDYAHMFKAWLSYMGYGNLSIAYVEIRMHYPTKTSAHAVNLVITDDKKVQLLEPQQSFVWDPKTPEPGWPGLIEQKLYLVEF